MLKAQALYGFDAQPSSGELSIQAGETLTILRQDIGDGWWEGTNNRGQTGLFPQSYVELMPDNGPPSEPLPPLPPLPPTTGYNNTQPASYSNGNTVTDRPSQDDDPFGDFDSDLEDEESQALQSTTDRPDIGGAGAGSNLLSVQHGESSSRRSSHASSIPPGNRTRSNTLDSIWSSDTDPVEQTASASAPSSQLQQHSLANRQSSQPGGIDPNRATTRKNFNRFSNFVKSGTEAYVLNTARLTGHPLEKFEIILSDTGPRWSTVNEPAYTCVVDKPKKESKMKGLKSFIAYQITPSFNGIQVSRRYKHFDWLHERLQEKFSFAPIPPLPEKQVSGKFEDDLIEHRKQILQLWVDKICRHPVIYQSDVWKHFLTCTDEKKWKQGKRKAEKDDYMGGSFFFGVTVPKQQLDQNDIQNRVEQFARTCKSLDDSVRQVFEKALDMSKKMPTVYRRDYEKFGLAFDGLANSFTLDDSPNSAAITQAIRHTAAAYHDVGNLYDNQAKNDMEPLMDALYMYKGMLNAVPDIVSVHKQSVAKLRDQERLVEEDKSNLAESEALRQRVDTISYVTLAEMAHFRDERRNDFKQSISAMLYAQIELHQQVTNRLTQALRQFDEC